MAVTKKLASQIAVEGCGHGQLDKIYEAIQHAERTQGIKVDLLICCGDFQAVRNNYDLSCMAVPQKYRHMGDFYKYYTGEKVAPILTLFIHGNHEAGNHLQELYAGGWVAPNIYYMGYSNILRFGGLRIGGLSGIHREKYYRRGYFERAPYGAEEVRSVYYVREYEVWKLKHFKAPIDIFVSHDWPLGIYYTHCDVQQLIRTKPFFEQEIKSNTLGSVANRDVLNALKPAHWFSAHLHVKFPAVVQHGPIVPGVEPQVTKFLALDKCLPHRDYLQIIEFPDVPESEKVLKYDLEWLAILKASLKYYSTNRSSFIHPDTLDLEFAFEYVKALQETNPGGLDVPLNFSQVVPAYPNDATPQSSPEPLQNPQTQHLLKLLGVDISDRLVYSAPQRGQLHSSSSTTALAANPEEIDLGDDEIASTASATPATKEDNPEEINLDDL